ncbi:hypothetical protein [Desulfitobacterium hafniense]|uniref:hypothetical protein n=1 Tax=Desulfitobacterium hafniense TaxID=49338 RepID=UPI0003683B7A|nr:hypothetical protein [Desulfitobacterium hafniense]
MSYEDMVIDFTQTWHSELFRRLRDKGYEVSIIDDNDTYANIYQEDALVAQINQNNELKGDWSGKAIKKIAEETAEYIFMYKTSPDLICSRARKQLKGYRKLLAYNDKVLAARLTQGMYQFATGYRALLSSNHYILDKSFNHYAKACEDFALRAGLVDQEKLFNVSEMKVIRAGLTQLLTMNPPQITFDELKAYGNILNKISFILVPEVKQVKELNKPEYSELEL